MSLKRRPQKRRTTTLAGIIGVAFLLAFGAQARDRQESPTADAKLPSALVRGVHKAPIGSIQDAYQLDLRDGTQRYRLSPSDVILVTFPRFPELNQTITLQPDGFVTMAEIGDIRLAGLTTEGALAAIQSAYSLTLNEPLITIELRDFNRPYFIVSGEVRRPGKYDLRGFTSATEALATAGGFKASARRSSVLLFRRAGDDWYDVKPLNVKKLLEGRGINEDVEIRDGDMIVVPSTVFSRIKRTIF
jgi:polysaccharide biosynthesis/export protein